MSVVKKRYVNFSSEPVEIPSYHKPERKRSDESFLTEEDFLLEDLTDEQKKAIILMIGGKVNALAEERRLEADEEAERIAEQARDQAAQVVAAAKLEALRTADEADRDAVRIKQEAHLAGIREGRTEKQDEIAGYLTELHQKVKEIEQQREDFFEEYQDNLKYLALEIAQRLVYKKIDEDDTYLAELVRAAVKEAREAEWITVTLAKDATVLADKLTAEFAQAEKPVEFEAAAEQPGTVYLSASDRTVDASVQTQAENFKAFLKRGGAAYERDETR